MSGSRPKQKKQSSHRKRTRILERSGIHVYYTDRVDKRNHLRIPVTMALLVKVEGKATSIFFDTHIINFSHGGICIIGNFCDKCTGYSPGEIHPKCVLAPYDANDEDSNDLYFTIETPENEKDITFCGKAAYTFKQGKDEVVGIVFSSTPHRRILEIEKLYIPDEPPIL